MPLNSVLMLTVTSVDIQLPTLPSFCSLPVSCPVPSTFSIKQSLYDTAWNADAV